MFSSTYKSNLVQSSESKLYFAKDLGVTPRLVWKPNLLMTVSICSVDMQCFPVYCACYCVQAQNSRRSWWLVVRSACGENMWMQPISVHAYGERSDVKQWICCPNNSLKETYINQTLICFLFYAMLACTGPERVQLLRGYGVMKSRHLVWIRPFLAYRTSAVKW